MVALDRIGSPAEVEAIWRSMTVAANHSFFMSWPWIRTWLTCLPQRVQPYLMLVSHGGPIIAAAIMVRRTLRRHAVFPSRTWVLNATGDPDLDQIFIEHNGLLARAGNSTLAWNAWAESFIHDHHDWDEVQLRGVPPEALKSWEHPTTRLREEMTLTTRYVDLNTIRATGKSFLDTLGKKKRARIRYTRQIYERHGPMPVEVAQTTAQALSFFQELKVLHQRRWLQRHERGAFGYPFFETFHTRLITDHFADGIIQLLRVRAADQTVGVLYNFVYQGDVVVYQTGFNYDLVQNRNKESPGLMTHALAIDHNIACGYRRYDLLAGDSEYKQALADNCEQLWWGRIQRQRLRFRAEDGLRSAWQYVSRDLHIGN